MAAKPKTEKPVKAAPKKNAPKKVPVSKKVLDKGTVSKVEKVVAPVEEKKAKAVSEPRTCKECGNPFESKYSGSLYCPECAVIKKRERRKAAQKRRKANRKDELTNLREFAKCIENIDEKDNTKFRDRVNYYVAEYL